jgi:hypothetical protein
MPSFPHFLNLKPMKTLLPLFLALFLLTDVFSQEQTCFTPEVIAPIKSYAKADPLNGDYCVSLYVEVDYDIYQDKGANTVSFIEGLMREVSKIYLAQDITLSIEYFYHTSPSPYDGASASQLLTQFRQERETHPGDVAMLLSYKGSGGIAYVDVICNENFGYSFSSIRPTYENYPTYSWSTMVIAHELGHNLGSPHTHSCAWNGNGTAIDGCSPFGTSGDCDNPGFPENGGTIMSYCHLQGSVGINLNKGFHPQPLALMKNRIADAQCVDCDDNPPPPVEGCQENEVIVEVLLDFFPHETAWQIMQGSTVIAIGGPYSKSQMNTIVSDTLCLPDGCYEFAIADLEGDGLSTIGCSEGMYIVTGPGGEISSGQDFGGLDMFDFCLGGGSNCQDVNFREVRFLDYSNQNQTDGFAIIEDELRLNGNTWKAIEYDFPENSTVSFEYFVELRGEIQGIGFTPTAEALYPGYTYNIAGYQPWGNRSLLREVTGWETFELPVPSNAKYIVFVNDEDRPVPVSASKFRNVKVCSGGVETTLDLKGAIYRGGEVDVLRLPYPNPTADTLNIPLTPWSIYDIFGREVMKGQDKTASIATLPPGTYFLHYGENIETIVKL